MNLLGALIPTWLIVAFAGVVLAVGAAFAYHMGARVQYGQDADHFTKIIKERDDEIVDYKQRAANAQTKFNQLQQELIRQGLDFDDQLKSKDAALAAAVAPLRTQLAGLQHQLASRVPAGGGGSNAAAPAAPSQPDGEAAILRANFGESAGRLVEMGELAASLSDKLTSLQDWTRQFCPVQGSSE